MRNKNHTRSVFDINNYNSLEFANTSWVFLLALLIMVGGSVATALFFGAGIVALYTLIKEKSLWKRAQQLPNSTYLYPLFLIIILITGLIADNPSGVFHSFGSNLQFVVLPLMIIRLMQTHQIDYLAIFIKGIRVGMPIAFVTGIIQFSFARPPYATGAMSNALIYSSIVFLGTWISIIGIKNDTKFWRYLAIFAFMCGVGTITLTLRKSAIFTFPIFTLFAFIYFYKIKMLSFRKLILMVLGIVLFATIGISVSGSRGRFVEARILPIYERFEKYGVSLHGLGDASRVNLYFYGWKTFKENPFLGVGAQNKMNIVIEAAKRDGVKIRRRTHLHSEIIDASVRSGLFGLISYLAILFAPLLFAVKSPRDRTYFDRVFFATTGTVGIGLLSLTNLLTGHDLMLNIFVTMAILTYVSCMQSKADPVKYRQ